MKNKIALRLTAYFSAALLVFSLVVGFVFIRMFNRYTTTHYRDTMLIQAQAIAANAAPVICNANSNSLLQEQQTGGGHGHRNGQNAGMQNFYSSYLDSIQAVVVADIWLVDREAQLVTQGRERRALSYAELPENAENVIAEVYNGKNAFSESFSDFLGEKTVTVGVPVTAPDGAVIGVVLLHSPVEGLAQAQNKGLQILFISMALALILACAAAIVLSLKFTRPLNSMKQNALAISQGDYTAKNNIRQKDEIGELATAMDDMADKLALAAGESARLEAMRKDFIASVSHELRTPVTVMRGSLEAICDGVVTSPEKVEEYHRQLLSESIHMQRLVNDLLDLTRLQNAEFHLEMDHFTLNEAVNDAARGMRRIAEEKQVELLVQVPVSPSLFYGDYSRIRQMLVAVTDNAIKFSPCGGTVHITQQQADNVCTISITDNGPGISQQELPHIFSRFHSIKNRQNKSGTGLGLAITNEIAKRHGVEITVTSQPGHTCFVFTFPTIKQG